MSNACVGIGVKGLCSDEYQHYLDTYGVSLAKAAKIADTAFLTGKNLVDEMVELAWKHVFDDVDISGFKMKGITYDYSNTFTTQTTTLTNDYSLKIDTCKYESFKLKSLKIKVIGTLDVTININGTETTQSYTDQTLLIENEIYKSFDFTLSVSGVGVLQLADTGTPFEISYEVFCNEKLFFCNYVDWIVEAVKIKASALILNAGLYSDRYNDFIVYKKDQLGIQIAQLDTSLISLKEGLIKEGLYQQEIKKISEKMKAVIKRSECCECCFECQNYFQSQITIP